MTSNICTLHILHTSYGNPAKMRSWLRIRFTNQINRFRINEIYVSSFLGGSFLPVENDVIISLLLLFVLCFGANCCRNYARWNETKKAKFTGMSKKRFLPENSLQRRVERYKTRMIKGQRQRARYLWFTTRLLRNLFSMRHSLSAYVEWNDDWIASKLLQQTNHSLV